MLEEILDLSADPSVLSEETDGAGETDRLGYF